MGNDRTEIGGQTRGTPLQSPEVSDTGHRIKVVFGKLRMDAHDVGARFVMRRLVDAGMEVVFVRFALVDHLVETAAQEDARVLAVSALTGGHLVVAEDMMKAVRGAGLDDCLVLMGGVIADEDHAKLRSLGVDGVFGPGSSTDDIVKFILENVSVDQ